MKDVNLLTSNGVNVDQSLELFGDMDTYNDTLEEFLAGVGEKLENIKKQRNGEIRLWKHTFMMKRTD